MAGNASGSLRTFLDSPRLFPQNHAAVRMFQVGIFRTPGIEDRP